jgi:dolichol-phosphate mannosyltransferase
VTKSLICIPTYNEKDNVLPLAAEIFKIVPAGTDLLFIDDASPDGTGKLLDAFVREDLRVHVLHRHGKLGLATAYLQGFQWGLAQGYEILFQMDADLSHDAAHLLQFFAAFEAGAAAVCGSRYTSGGAVSNWSGNRLLLSRMGSFYSRMWLRYPLRDWTGGFNGWRADLLKTMHLGSIRSKGHSLQIEMKYRALVLGKDLVEVPIVFHGRRAGASKMSSSVVMEALLEVCKLRWRFEVGNLF